MRKKAASLQVLPPIEDRIYEIHGDRVILDTDLAAIYGVETKALNRAVKRNRDRFPKDFMFQISEKEWRNLKYQFGTSSSGHGGRRRRPYAFTEHGALQAANVLRSQRAVQMSLFVIRAFLKMRRQLATNTAIQKRLAGDRPDASRARLPVARSLPKAPDPPRAAAGTARKTDWLPSVILFAPAISTARSLPLITRLPSRSFSTRP